MILKTLQKLSWTLIEVEIVELPLCKQKQDSYIVTYPKAVEFAQAQASIAWIPEEVAVEEDIHEFLTTSSEADKHGLIYNLKLFTLYEMQAGSEYWSGRFTRMFPRICMRRMANAFAYAELNMHAPFYSKINECLHIDTEEFYQSYLEDPVLSDRMRHIDSIINHKEDLVSLGAFSLVEGAILYSSFAFLKHYRANGKNQFKGLNSGIAFSVRDENLHSEGGAWAYGILKSESNLEALEVELIEAQIVIAAKMIYEHEKQIIEATFSLGHIAGISQRDMKAFVKSRLNLCLGNLGIKPIYTVNVNPVADWFYDNINAVKLHDFFDTTGSEYHRRWNMERFSWSNKIEDKPIKEL